MTTNAEELDRKCTQAMAILDVLREFPLGLETRHVSTYACQKLGLNPNTVEGRSHPLSLWDTSRTRYVLRWLAKHGDVECIPRDGRYRDLAWKYAHPEHSPLEEPEWLHVEPDDG